MLIGLTGLKQSGKNAVGDWLQADHGFLQASYAGKLKQIAVDLWDLSDEQVNGDAEKKEAIDPRWGVSPRHLMQVLGTEVVRNAHPETWIRYAMRQTDTMLSVGESVAITDVRFENEAQAIKGRGGYIVRVVRPGTETGDQHASETEMAGIEADYVLVNDSTLSALYAKIDEMLEELCR